MQMLQHTCDVLLTMVYVQSIAACRKHDFCWEQIPVPVNSRPWPALAVFVAQGIVLPALLSLQIHRQSRYFLCILCCLCILTLLSSHVLMSVRLALQVDARCWLSF